MAIVISPPAIVQAVELDDFGAPDFLGHGWMMTFGPELVTGAIYIERIERGVIRRQVVCRAHFPRSRWMQAIDMTLVGVRGGGVH